MLDGRKRLQVEGDRRTCTLRDANCHFLPSLTTRDFFGLTKKRTVCVRKNQGGREKTAQLTTYRAVQTL